MSDYICPFCLKLFKNSRSLSTHKSIYHKQTTNEPVSDEKLTEELPNSDKPSSGSDKSGSDESGSDESGSSSGSDESNAESDKMSYNTDSSRDSNSDSSAADSDTDLDEDERPAKRIKSSDEPFKYLNHDHCIDNVELIQELCQLVLYGSLTFQDNDINLLRRKKDTIRKMVDSQQSIEREIMEDEKFGESDLCPILTTIIKRVNDLIK